MEYDRYTSVVDSVLMLHLIRLYQSDVKQCDRRDIKSLYGMYSAVNDLCFVNAFR